MRLSIACAATLLGFFLFSAGAAEKVLVDWVVAVVEDEAIFKSELDQTVKQYLIEQGLTSAGPEQKLELEKKALEDLIKNELILAQAKRLDLQVSFSEIEENVERAIGRNKEVLGGEEGFNRQLKLEGLTLDQLKKLYREQIRNRMLVEKVLAAEIDRSKIRIGDEELRAYYEKKKPELPSRPAVVHLASIFFALESSTKARSEARKKIEDIYKRILEGADFSEMAKAYSEDPSAERGGDLGFLNLQDIGDKEFAREAEKLSPGELSPPVLTSYGYHIIKVEEEDSTSNTVHLRHILIRAKPKEDDIKEVYERADSVHDLLRAGEPFDSLAARFSDEVLTASSGGDIGWLKVQDLPEFFREVLGGMEVGDISQVLRESNGFRIVKLLGKEEERDYRFDEIKEELAQLLEQEKLSEAYDSYIEGLKQKFYVHVHDQ